LLTWHFSWLQIGFQCITPLLSEWYFIFCIWTYFLRIASYIHCWSCMSILFCSPLLVGLFYFDYLLEWGCLYFWSMLWCKNCIFEMSCGSAFNLYWSNQWSLFLFLLLMLHTYLNMLLLQLFNLRHCF